MRTKSTIITALLIAMATALPAANASVEIDITDDANSQFFIGYRHKYAGDCEVAWFASQWGREYLLGECKNVSNERAYQDAVKLMERARARSSAKNFVEYFNEGNSNAHAAIANKTQFCLDTMQATYVFLDAPAANRPGWRYIDRLANGGRLRTEIVGYWKSDGKDSVIADLGLTTIDVNMGDTYAC